MIRSIVRKCLALLLGVAVLGVAVLGAGQAPVERSDGPAQFPGRLNSRHAFQVAIKQGRAILFRQQAQLMIEPVKCRTHVLDFAAAMIVLAMAQPSAAKIETQHRKPKLFSAFMA